MKKIPYSKIIFGLSIGTLFLMMGLFETEAASTDFVYETPVNCVQYCPDEGLIILAFKGNLSGKIIKKINFKSEQGKNVPLDFILNIGKTITYSENASIGSWVATGSHYDTPPSDGSLYKVYEKFFKNFTSSVSFNYTAYIGTSVPVDNSTSIVTSSNPGVVSCDKGVCKALKKGTSKITVNFKSIKQTSKNKILNNTNGYGVLHIKGRNEAYEPGGPTLSENSDPVTVVYSFPPITYNVTVPELPNTPHSTTCSQTTNIKDSSATVNWTYTDKEDLQAQYHVQLSKKSFSDPTFVNTDVVFAATRASSAKSHTFANLVANTTYYARIRTYNAVNGWSAWTTGATGCSSFKTLPPPIVPPSTFSSSCSNSGNLTISKGDTKTGPVTFTAQVTNATGTVSYQWYNGGNSITGATTGTYTINSITNPDKRYEWAIPIGVKVTNGNGVSDSTKSCTVSVRDNNYPPTPPGTDGGDGPDVQSFFFSPNITSGTECPLYLEAEKVGACYIKDRANREIKIPSNSSYEISVTGDMVAPIGTHTLYCKSTSTSEYKPYLTPQRCYSNFDIRED